MAAITPTPGVVYNFIFDPGYDKYNGIYRLVKLMTYEEFLADGGDILQSFYSPNGKDETDVNNDLSKLYATKIMKLANPDELEEAVEIFAPLMYLTETPDHNVKEYQRFGIVSEVGITDNVDHLDFALDAINESMEGALGITPKTHLITLGSKWLTDAQYQELLSERDENLKKVINYFKSCKDLERRLAQEKTKVQLYEQTVVNMQKQIDELKAIIEE